MKPPLDKIHIGIKNSVSIDWLKQNARRIISITLDKNKMVGKDHILYSHTELIDMVWTDFQLLQREDNHLISHMTCNSNTQIGVKLMPGLELKY